MKEKRKDPRVARNQKLLKNAFIDLLTEKQYEDITIRNISEHATLKRSTFYLHFRDKQDLLQQACDECLGKLSIVVRPKLSSEEKLLRMYETPQENFLGLFSHVAQHYKFYKATLVINRVSYVIQRLSNVLNKFITDGLQLAEPDDSNLTAKREVIITYGEAAYLGIITWWVKNDMPYSKESMAVQLLNLAARGPYIEPLPEKIERTRREKKQTYLHTTDTSECEKQF